MKGEVMAKIFIEKNKFNADFKVMKKVTNLTI